MLTSSSPHSWAELPGHGILHILLSTGWTEGFISSVQIHVIPYKPANIKFNEQLSKQVSIVFAGKVIAEVDKALSSKR